MGIRESFAAVAISLTVSIVGRADEATVAVVEPSQDVVRLPYADLPLSPPTEPNAIVQTQYLAPLAPEPELTYVPPYPATPPPPPPPPCCEICGSFDGCQCDAGWCHSGWNLGIELYGLQSHLADSAFGRWPDDGGGAAQLSLGYEWLNGFGMRGNWWSFFEDASVPGPDVELSMATFQLDFYKSMVSGHSELLIGAGPAGGGLKFRIPSFNERSEFRGGGATAFAEGYFPFMCRPLWELAFVGKTRWSLLAGEWRDNGSGIVDDTDGDSVSIWEIGFGLEYRHRCGRCYDHYWFVQAMPEYQQWSSSWMTDQLASSVALTGMNVNFGFAW